MSVDLISRSKSLATSSDGLPAANTLRDLRRLAATFGPEIGLRDLSTGSPMTASGGRRRGASMAYQAAASICRTLTTLGRRIFRPASGRCASSRAANTLGCRPEICMPLSPSPRRRN
jgi:hypothetical protein